MQTLLLYIHGIVNKSDRDKLVIDPLIRSVIKHANDNHQCYLLSRSNYQNMHKQITIIYLRKKQEGTHLLPSSDVSVN